MAVDIGPKIGIDGEKEFRNQINNLTQQVKTFGAELKTVASAAEVEGDAIKTASDKKKILTDTIDTQKKKLDLLKKSLDESAAKFGEADNKTLKWRQAVANTQTELNKLEFELSKVNSELENAGQEMQETASSADELGDALDNASDEASSFGDVLKGSLASDAISSTISAVKDSVLDIGKSLSEYSIEAENAASKATAYFGETGEAAEQTAQLIKDVYTGGVGDSMDEVADAVITVKKNIDGLNQTNIKNITDQAITLDKTFGIDMNETLRGANSLMENFGLSAQEAMDYIVVGTQNGLDKTNELGDNLAEYAGKFAQAGYSAQDYFQLLNNGLDGGAYNLDKVNDAINEVTTRLADGTIAEAIDLYSFKTIDLYQAWLDGEATQKDVIDSIVNDIKRTTNQQEALNMAAQAFGTMAEDGNLQFIESLDSVGSAYDNVRGKAQEMFDATTTSQQNLDSAIRTAQDSLQPVGDILNNMAAKIIPNLAQAFANWAQGIDWKSVQMQIENIVTFIRDFISAIIDNKDVILAAISGIAAGFVAWNIASIITGVITQIKNLGGVLPALQTAISGVNAVLKANPIGLVVSLIAGLAAAFITAYNTSDEFREKVNAAFGAVKDFIGTAVETIKNAVTNAFNAVKDAVSTAVEAVQNVVQTVWEFITTETDGKMGIIQEVVQTVFDFIKTHIENIMTAIQGIIKTVTQIISGDWSGAWETIKTTVTTIWDNIKNTVSNAIEGLKNAIGEKVSAIKTSVVNKFNEIKNFLSGLPNQFLTMGRNIIQGLIKGITEKVSGAVEAVKNAASNMIGGAKKILGIKSPSRVFKNEVGKNIMLGLADGVLQNVNYAVRAARSAAGSVTNAFDGTQIPVAANGTVYAYNQMAASMGKLQVVLNDGTLVGKIAPKMDATLGGYTKMKGRYNVSK